MNYYENKLKESIFSKLAGAFRAGYVKTKRSMRTLSQSPFFKGNLDPEKGKGWAGFDATDNWTRAALEKQKRLKAAKDAKLAAQAASATQATQQPGTSLVPSVPPSTPGQGSVPRDTVRPIIKSRTLPSSEEIPDAEFEVKSKPKLLPGGQAQLSYSPDEEGAPKLLPAPKPEGGDTQKLLPAPPKTARARKPRAPKTGASPTPVQPKPKLKVKRRKGNIPGADLG